jgi:CubicO group peptidase (beta-lactamase class C family)
MSQPVSISRKVRFDGSTYPIHGFVATGFEAVADQFARNFERGGEVGATAAATLGGRPVVDLWGGFQDRARTRPWEKDTLVCMMSVNKAIVATCIARAMEQGFFDSEDFVCRYWPEFGAAGKEKITIQWLLDHRAGLPVVEPRLPPGSIYDRERMVAALAQMTPLWEPGTQAGYHILTQGFLLGEVLRRTTGKTVGRYFRDEIAGPLGVDYHNGLAPEEHGRCADYCMVLGGTILDEAAQDPLGWQGRAWAQLKTGEDFNSPEWRSAEICSANGHGNARAVARLMAALANGGTLDGYQVLGRSSVERMRAEQHHLREVVMQRPYHQASGVLLNSPPISFQGPNPRAFGHHGVGGSIGFADPENAVSFAYGMNQMHQRKDNGPRAGLLIQALYESMGIACRTPDYSESPVARWD